ncbi:hypothetical protein RB195_010285 [Necator americanus]|uniref:Uncharacterized protein n=1 Tax=Necator americanus TaxID=51031 RepID=A0ABR1CX88_NECAM
MNYSIVYETPKSRKTHKLENSAADPANDFIVPAMDRMRPYGYGVPVVEATEEDRSMTGKKLSARTRQHSEAFYDILRGHQLQRVMNNSCNISIIIKGDVTPDHQSSTDDTGILRRSSERKRCPRRTFSPHSCSRKRENGLLMVGTVHRRLKFTVECPDGPSKGMLDHVRIDVEKPTF